MLISKHIIFFSSQVNSKLTGLLVEYMTIRIYMGVRHVKKMCFVCLHVCMTGLLNTRVHFCIFLFSELNDYSVDHLDTLAEEKCNN